MTFCPSRSLWGWQVHARCRPTVEHLFFAQDTERSGERIRRERSAKRICEHCPVRVECRQHALVHPEEFGIWGGASERDRQKSLFPRNSSHHPKTG
ncbi:WhiB family transcriptional regulator [Rhodococcus wratislaviensis]|uniref:WhiB family transcriptional regulator n=1 Tax=Rhodococcus wratislaviensis TaxID=44752 RepID=UPI003513B733